MALGGNPIFNGKNFRGATQAPPAPQAYGQRPPQTTARRPMRQNYGQPQYGQTQAGWNAGQQAMSSEQLQDLYNRPAAGPADAAG